MKRIALLSCLLASTVSIADEGMWQPHQLPKIASKLVDAGLKLNPNSLTDLTGFPMGAIVSLGGCTASFVSDKGLVATNHHCVYGSVQYNSTEENNLLKNGFLAKSFEQELPATPGTRIYVTEQITPVTDIIQAPLNTSMTGSERYNLIEKTSKTLVGQCESDAKYRCSVVNFHGGLEYYLFKQLTIRDVRLVHAPASSVGKYGGDIDNWMWPRHTGDYGFYRAYVGKDGQPADYSADNVPYEPAHHLKVNKSSVDENDYIMVLGYPGRTNRYRTVQEVENQFTWTYPTAKAYREEIIKIIHDNSAPGSDARIKYESTLASLANYAKNYGSMIESYHKGTTLARKKSLETDLNQWINTTSQRQEKYGDALKGLNKLITQDQKYQARDLILGYMNYSKMLSTATRLYRLSLESKKPNIERKAGFQERDIARFEQSMSAVERRYDAQLDQKILVAMFKHYSQLPASQRLASLDAFFDISTNYSEQKIQNKLSNMYQKTKLNELDTRLAWMHKSPEDFNKSDDPFILLAIKTFDDRKKIEEANEELAGNIQTYRPMYMSALIAYFNSIDLPVYADANSTLRVTYGNVKGYSPQDGIVATPFTTLEGIVSKDTGVTPFDAPKKLLNLIKEQQYGEYAKKELSSVPVNFLGTLDITGGNSGSPTLNDKAEFVGLVFDGVYESIIGDWDYDTKLNRSIHVDIKYMLWVMEHVDGATNLIEEMDIVQ